MRGVMRGLLADEQAADDIVQETCLRAIERPAGRCVAVEVKATGTVRAADFTGLGRLKEALGDRFVRGVLLHLGSGPHALPFGERLEALPVSALWLRHAQ